MPTIYQEIVVNAPCQRCFDLTRSVDFHVASSQEISARARGGRRGGLSSEGDSTVWSARFLGVRSLMETKIEALTDAVGFRDRMTRGLLRRFEHTYRFRPREGSGCVVSDELIVEAPFPVFGRMVERVYLCSRMRTLVGRRLAAIKCAAESDDWRRYLPC